MPSLMHARRHSETGTSLIEIIFAIVILGIIVSALTAVLSTSENGTAVHRQLVTADATLRDYAESVKAAVRTSCSGSGGTWTSGYSPPSGFTINALGAQACPAVTTTSTVALSTTMPNGVVKHLSIAVRTP